MRAAFRVDASSSVGGGHAARCLVLADALRARGVPSTFLSRNDPGHPAEWISRRGFETTLLPPSPLSPSADATATAQCLPSDASILVVDHYALGAEFETALRPRVKTLLAVDDLARPHACDLLLDQNLLPDPESRYLGKLPPSCRLLLGPSFVLLDPSFAALAPSAADRSALRRLLLFFGGADADDLTRRALLELDPLSIPGDVVVGASNPRRAEIEDLCARRPSLWTLHVQTNRMAELVARADFALGAGGCSHWERCLLGLPAAVVAVAPNQLPATRKIASRGACLFLGEIPALADGDLRRAVESFRADPQALAAMSRAARAILPDGNGAGRVADAILENRP